MNLITDQNKCILKNLINQLLNRCLSAQSFEWISTKSVLIEQEEGAVQLSMTFAQVSRYAPKIQLDRDAPEIEAIGSLVPGCDPSNWSVATLCRIALIMRVKDVGAELYLQKISGLFTAAEMNELVALYTALPFLEHSTQWIARCEEGIRSNIGIVLEAIMYGNPYPAAFLPEASWNQMVLKAFFTDKNVEAIIGLKERNNSVLQSTLKDYIEERVAAGRIVQPGIYTLIY
ncbi:EboA domain-containing protein [Pedobacter antarcticus]|uniref:EboA domain-containing protein n=1 Tax=Pedobacter antarcticus TaxID=34086 RepID=UPI0008851C0A|nr:EboA domain-containing protein [Pedobacter antarcticus]SDM73375.1 hypothetical protein SAMN04488084_11277 [Pedobacter antarcticus]